MREIAPTFWLIMMRLAIATSGTICVYTSIFHEMIAKTSYGFTLALTASAVLSASLIGPCFMKSWTGGFWGVFWASAMTSVMAAGLAFDFAVVSGILFFGDELTAAMSLPASFISGALIAPVAIITNPVTACVWTVGAVIIALLARRVVAARDRLDAYHKGERHAILARSLPRALHR